MQGKITTNLKTINNQKCQKIKLHGILTTKELKKHSLRLVGGQRRENGSPADRTHSKAVNCVSKAGLAEWETRLKTSCKILWGLQQREKLSVSQESLLESGATVE